MQEIANHCLEIEFFDEAGQDKPSNAQQASVPHDSQSWKRGAFYIHVLAQKRLKSTFILLSSHTESGPTTGAAPVGIVVAGGSLLIKKRFCS
jgi:hypothetical protein